MSAIVEAWVSEMAKLKEKVRPKKPLLFLSLSRKAEGVIEEDKKAEKETKVVQRRETSMSEATVCMLMDRFAPW